MKHYTCIIKSHCEAPDFELEFEAENKEAALDHLQKHLDFDRETLNRYLLEEEL